MQWPNQAITPKELHTPRGLASAHWCSTHRGVTEFGGAPKRGQRCGIFVLNASQ